MALVFFVKRHRYTALHCTILLVVVAVCVPLLVLVPEARPYTATLLAWTLAFAVRLWQWLPSERASVQRRAHRRADARMRERGVGSVHGSLKQAHPTSAAFWSLVTLPHREGECDALGCRDTPDGGDSSGGASCAPPLGRRKFLLDRGDVSSSSCALVRSREEEEEEQQEASYVVTAPAPLLWRESSLPPFCISASALESSSQFLALASPCRSSLPAVAAAAVSVCHSHEPFTHVSRRSPSSPRTASTSSLSTLSLSTIMPEEGMTASGPLLFSTSPASSCQTHGYAPPSLPDSPSPSPLFDDDDDDGDGSARASLVSPPPSLPTPVHLSLLAASVR